MKIAIVGSGISGLTAAYLLSKEHQVTIFEREERIGGHTATVDVSVGGREYAIDTGFIVFNDRTYPNFIRLLTELGVASRPSEMSFSVSCDRTGLEYAGTNLNTVFAQRGNMFRPRYLRMLLDIVRFNRRAAADLESGRIAADLTLGEYLRSGNYSAQFATDYLVPMGAAIWSSGSEEMYRFPLQFFVRFFRNHGLLDLANRPQWRVVEGGSRSYLGPLTASFSQHIHTASPVVAITRDMDSVTVTTGDGMRSAFDQLIMATHSDQALALLPDASGAEREVLGAIPYQENDVVLHTDKRMLPSLPRAWSSWNYRISGEAQPRARLTYNMNILQGIDSPETFCVSLNSDGAIDPDSVLGQYQYSHPVFTLDGIKAQGRWGDINGVRRTWFCGAYWANGFHEDGVSSALRVCQGLGVEW